MPAAKVAELLSQHHLPNPVRHDTTIMAETAAESLSLLTAALGDWVDFLYVPAPKPFVLYADHDEYTTFFASRQSNLHPVTSALTAGGFARVEGYLRHFR